MKKTNKTAVFTIVSLNYGAFARTLMESLSTTHPEWDRHVLLVDRCEDPASVGGDLFSAMTVEQLPLPKMREFLFRYGIMELNTAAKPYMFARLRRQGYERVVYIDPDILVLDRLEDVERLLDEGAAAVVTPHLTAPLDDGLEPSELDIMRAGSYNLGFLALGSLPASDAFIKWWEDKLEYGAVSDPARGLFTDQKWVDMAPGMFGGFAVLRDPGYNVAYWNLPHRPVTRQGNAWLAGGRPLRFFHFSGFDPQNPQPFSKHQNRLRLDTIGEARELALEYARRVLSHGFAEFRKHPYAFGGFSEGTPIPPAIRLLYREDADVRFQAGENPFDSADYFVYGNAGNLPPVLRGLWLEHQHLQRMFPDPLGSSRVAFYHWFTESGGVEAGISDIYILPVRRALAGMRASGDKAIGPDDQPSVWTKSLVYLHKKATGGKLGAARLQQYQKITGPVAFAQLAFGQFRGSRWASKVGLALPDTARLDPLQAAAAYGDRSSGVPLVSPSRRISRFSGLYAEPGKNAWWVGRQARFVILDSPASGTLRLQGIHHPDMHQRAHGNPVLSMSLGLDDGDRSTVKISDAGPFDISIDLKQLPQTWPATLHLRPETSFVPNALGDSDDVRHLSLQIASISIGGIHVFNAAQQPPANLPQARGAPGVNVIGYARSEHGVGQSLRQFTGALDAAAIPSAIIDFNNNNNSRVEDRSLESRLVTEPVHAINVFHINADQMTEAEMNLPAHLFSRYNIGFWHWELPNMLDEHLAGFNSLNEIWVPTGFVQEAVAKRSPVPVVRMPHAIHFSISPDASRARFNLPEDTFLFLMMYDFSSYQERKNPQAALDAFDQAFGKGNDNAGNKAALVIKTQNAQFHNADVAALRDRLAGRSDVIWINETMTRQEVYDLQSVCDALVSLHRSEGYGLGPAEAMFLGKPVIATNWSGNTEFMRPQNSLPVNYTLVQIEKDVGVYKAGQTWANADVGHAAELMRRIVEDGELRARISAEARRTMAEEYSPAVIGRRILDRLEYIQAALQK
ncbi:glycosyltransferase [Undibacterium sp. TJN25]|uniref:glycosyltransferase n=1 Tax=Undibacterium sp. TJN25 TaxID=3413056 RepID=UPI003BF2BC83